MNENPLRQPRTFLLGLLILTGAPSLSLASEEAPATRPASRLAGKPAGDVESHQEIKRQAERLKKAVEDAQARLRTTTAESERMEQTVAGQWAAKVQAAPDSAAVRRSRTRPAEGRRNRLCPRRGGERDAAQAAALARAAAVEPYLPADDRQAIRVLPPDQRLDALAELPADDGLHIVLPELKFANVALADVFRFLSDVAPVQLHPDLKALEGAGVDRYAAITLHAQNLELDDLLALDTPESQRGRGDRDRPRERTSFCSPPGPAPRRTTGYARERRPATADAKSKEVLDQRVKVTFDDANLDDALDYLADVYGASLFPD